MTFDGSAINRKLLKIMSKEDIPFAVPNIYAEEERSILFFSDPPHLIKTTRNCWSSNCRRLWVSVMDHYGGK